MNITYFDVFSYGIRLSRYVADLHSREYHVLDAVVMLNCTCNKWLTLSSIIAALGHLHPLHHVATRLCLCAYLPCKNASIVSSEYHAANKLNVESLHILTLLKLTPTHMTLLRPHHHSPPHATRNKTYSSLHTLSSPFFLMPAFSLTKVERASAFLPAFTASASPGELFPFGIHFSVGYPVTPKRPANSLCSWAST